MVKKYLHYEYAHFEVIDEPNPEIDELFEDNDYQ